MVITELGFNVTFGKVDGVEMAGPARIGTWGGWSAQSQNVLADAIAAGSIDAGGIVGGFIGKDLDLHDAIGVVEAGYFIAPVEAQVPGCDCEVPVASSPSRRPLSGG